MPNLHNDKRGFTLIETLIAIAIFTMIMAGTATLFKAIYSGSGQNEQSIGNVDQARAAEFTFANEIRNAAVGVDGSYALNEASDSEIIFYSTYDSGTTTVDRVRYFVATSTLYKGIIAPSGNPLAYNANSEKITTVQTGLQNGAAPIFYYYDGSYNGNTAPLSQPINVTSVKFVNMNLEILIADEHNATSTFNISAGAAIRNLKTNLAN